MDGYDAYHAKLALHFQLAVKPSASAQAWLRAADIAHVNGMERAGVGPM